MERFKDYKVTSTLGALPEDTSYWTEKDWEKHHKYVEELKKQGRYLKKVETTISLIHDPMFDEPSTINEGKYSSYKVSFIN